MEQKLAELTKKLGFYNAMEQANLGLQEKLAKTEADRDRHIALYQSEQEWRMEAESKLALLQERGE